MIDSIVLTFDEDQFYVVDPHQFRPSLSLLQDRLGMLTKKAHTTFKRLPSREDLARGCYHPRFYISSRPHRVKGLQNILKIEFSAPKLLLKNNLEELSEADLPLLLDKLEEAISKAGLRIKIPLSQARVSAVHYSKNIVLRDGSVASMYMRELQKCNMSSRLDCNLIDYQNEGHALKYRTNTFEIIFYDKISDVRQSLISPKRTLEKNENLMQRGILDAIQAIQKSEPFEVLRFEVRLNKRQKIQSILRMIGEVVHELDFSALFSERISQKVLTHFFEVLTNAYPNVSATGSSDPFRLLTELSIKNPNANAKNLLAAIGYSAVMQNTNEREIRKLFRGNKGRQWANLKKSILALAPKTPSPPFFKTIKDQIRDFKPVKLIESTLGILKS